MNGQHSRNVFAAISITVIRARDYFERREVRQCRNSWQSKQSPQYCPPIFTNPEQLESREILHRSPLKTFLKYFFSLFLQRFVMGTRWRIATTLQLLLVLNQPISLVRGTTEEYHYRIKIVIRAPCGGKITPRRGRSELRRILSRKSWRLA